MHKNKHGSLQMYTIENLGPVLPGPQYFATSENLAENVIRHKYRRWIG